jgi:multiple sugar transport system permease protein/raffinose/stachyose/melibiose transport system permease protein
VGQVWIWIYQPDWGLLNTVLTTLGLEGLTRAWLGDPETSLAAVVVAWCWQQTALSLILYLAALTTIPRDLLEAAAIDGAGTWQQFRRIMLPLLRPASVVVISLAVINTLKGFDIVFMLTKGGPFHTSDNLAMFMYSETFFKYQVGYGAAIASALFLLAIIVIVLYFRQARASERLYD